MNNNPNNDGKQQVSLTSLLNRFRNSTRLASTELYGTDEKLYDDNNLDLIDIKNSVQSVRSRYTQNTSEDIVEFFNSVNLRSSSKTDDANNVGYLIKGGKNKNGGRELFDVRAILDNPESYSLNELFAQEVGRFQCYSSYKLIYDNIPQAAQALDTYVDNIMSPDDFTKTIFNVYVDNTLITSIDDDKNSEFNKITERCKDIIENYKLETLSNRILTEALMLGDCFVLCLPLNREIEKLTLSEALNTSSDNPFNISYEKTELSSNDISLTESELLELGNILFDNNFKRPEKPTLSESTSAAKTAYNKELAVYNENVKIFNENTERIKHDLAEIINKNILFSEDSSCLLEDNFSFYSDFAVKKPQELFNSFNPDQNKNEKDKRYSKTNYNKKSKITVNGAVVKVLKPERIVKLVLDDVEYGYYYVENVENTPDIMVSGAYSMTNNLFTTMKPLQQNENPDIMNAKYRLITDVFVKNISKKLNKKFINKHPEFKRTIYNLLKQDYIINKQVRLTYLAPNDVVHFGKGTGEYYDSIYKKVLFSAKLYLSVLTSQVMLKLVRSPDKRVFYVEVDLDQDTEAVVQSFMRDIKTKDIKMSNFGQDINTLLSSVGVFNDYYIPVVDGNKPLEIDTLIYDKL